MFRSSILHLGFERSGVEAYMLHKYIAGACDALALAKPPSKPGARVGDAAAAAKTGAVATS